MEAVNRVRLITFDLCLQEGDNILVVAAENGKEEMVKYLCNQCRIDPFVENIYVRCKMDDMLMM